MTIGSDGSRLIVREAHKAGPGNPLVVICGGQLTAVADAYLLDSSIAGKVVVAALLGSDKDMGGFNGKQDPWAAYIVLQRLIYVQFPQSQEITRTLVDLDESLRVYGGFLVTVEIPEAAAKAHETVLVVRFLFQASLVDSHRRLPLATPCAPLPQTTQN